jgi:hypothetical protein
MKSFRKADKAKKQKPVRIDPRSIAEANLVRVPRTYMPKPQRR